VTQKNAGNNSIFRRVFANRRLNTVLQFAEDGGVELENLIEVSEDSAEPILGKELSPSSGLVQETL
jgi:hypothetical protein